MIYFRKYFSHKNIGHDLNSLMVSKEIILSFSINVNVNRSHLVNQISMSDEHKQNRFAICLSLSVSKG